MLLCTKYSERKRIMMICDSHLHIFNLSESAAEINIIKEDRGYLRLSSSHSIEDMEYVADLKNSAEGIMISYGIHPWGLIDKKEERDFIEKAAGECRLNAIGEFGFDFFSSKSEEDIRLQTEYFVFQAEIASRFNLPTVLHIRKGYDVLFRHINLLKDIKAVVFHSFSGSAEDVKWLLKKGVNAFFSFGTPLLNNHIKAINVFRDITVDRLLLETDAPFQPLKGNAVTSVREILKVYEKAAQIRNMEQYFLAQKIGENFKSLFK